MGLFTPDWNSKDPEKRMNAVKNTAELEKLQKIAERAEYDDVRQEAWKRIALEANDWKVCKAAVEKITDETVLKEVVLKDSDNSVRKAAVKKITDEITLTKVALNDKDSTIRGLAVEKITDQAVLKKVVLKDSDCYVREAAVKKITDETVLKEVVLKDSYRQVCRTAIEKITDQAILKEIVLEDSDYYICEPAFNKITDKVAFLGIAKSSKNWEVRVKVYETLHEEENAAFEKLMHGNYTYSYVMNHDDGKAVQILLDQIHDRKMFQELSNDAKSELVRKEVKPKLQHIQLIDNSGLVFDNSIFKLVECVLNRYGAEKERIQAIENITNQKLLGEISKILDADNNNITKQLIDKLIDQSILTNVSKNARSYYIRMLAAEKLLDDTTKQEVAFDMIHLLDQDEISENRIYFDEFEFALALLTDQIKLKKLAKNARNGIVRIKAYQKLSDNNPQIVALLQNISKCIPREKDFHPDILKQNYKKLIELICEDKKAAGLLWDLMKDMFSTASHDDRSVHTDGCVRGSSEWSNVTYHTDHNYLQDMTFPPYPFND